METAGVDNIRVQEGSNSDSSFRTSMGAEGTQKKNKTKNHELLIVSIVSNAKLNTQLSRAAGIKPLSLQDPSRLCTCLRLKTCSLISRKKNKK